MIIDRKNKLFADTHDKIIISYHYADLFEDTGAIVLKTGSVFLSKNVQIKNQTKFAQRVIEKFITFLAKDRARNHFTYMSDMALRKYHNKFRIWLNENYNQKFINIIGCTCKEIAEYANNTFKYYVCSDLIFLIEELYYNKIVDFRFYWFSEINLDCDIGLIMERINLIKHHFGLIN